MCIVMLQEGWRKKLESRWEIDGNGAIKQQQLNFVSIVWDRGVYRGTSQSNWNVQNNGEKRNNESFSDRRSRFRNLCSELYEFFSVNFLQCQLYPARRLDWTGTDSMHSEQAQNTCAFIGNISSYSCFIISQILRTYSCLHFTSHCNKSPRSAHSKNFYGVHVDVENSNKRIASKLIVYAPLLPWISLEIIKLYFIELFVFPSVFEYWIKLLENRMRCGRQVVSCIQLHVQIGRLVVDLLCSEKFCPRIELWYRESFQPAHVKRDGSCWYTFSEIYQITFTKM